jgi:hypothetical protein
MNAAVRHLPLALTWLAPELARLDLPDETRADCANCPMANAPFHPKTRCCTYEPALVNFLAGRALSRNDRGSEKLRARIATGVGVGPLGVKPSVAWVEQYARKRETDFGRNPAWTCPYWVEGPLSCSIWRDRNATCRTWHCKHTNGVRAHRVWSALRKLASNCEGRLAGLCTRHIEAPRSAKTRDWVAYYKACARFVDQLAAEDLEILVDDELHALRADLRDAHEGLREPPADALGVEVRKVIDHGDEVELVGYTPWDSARFPKAVFVLLSEFDGHRPTGEAVQRAISNDAAVDPAWVQRLWDIGVLKANDADADVPWGFEGPDLSPETLAEQLDR